MGITDLEKTLDNISNDTGNNAILCIYTNQAHRDAVYIPNTTLEWSMGNFTFVIVYGTTGIRGLGYYNVADFVVNLQNGSFIKSRFEGDY